MLKKILPLAPVKSNLKLLFIIRTITVALVNKIKDKGSFVALLLISASAYGQVFQERFDRPPADTAWLSNLQGQGYTVALDSQTAYRGSHSIRLMKSPGEEGINHSHTFRNLPVQHRPWEKLMLAGYIKTANVHEVAHLWATVRDANDQVIYYENGKDYGVRGTTDWTLIQLPIILDSSATELRIGINLEGDGAAWFDDLEVYEDTVSSPIAKDALAYLQAVLDTIQQHSVKRDSIDWPGYRQRILSYTDGIKTIQDTYPIIQYGLRQLQDNHSRFISATQVRVSAQQKDYIQPTGSYLAAQRIGYVKVPQFNKSGAVGDAHADTLQSIIRTIDQQPVCGWIVDVRDNMSPMIAGLDPIIGEGKLGEFQAPDTVYEWYYHDGQAGYANTVIDG